MEQHPKREAPRPGVYMRPDGMTDIVVWAPAKEQIELVTADNTLTLPLVRNEWGYWHATTDQLQSGQLYNFRIDGDKTFPDPASVAQPDGVHGPSQVIARDFEWTDDAWKGIAQEDLVIYELHTGAFTNDHTFKGIIDKLPYLKDLGITAIELMPVNAFPGSRNWGYDGVYPFAVHTGYGGLAGLKELVNAAHAAGLAVILDVVYNHMGPDGNYLSEYAPYFTEKYHTPWGKALNFDDAYCDGVRNFFIHNVRLWLEECHIDGLRMDAVHSIWDFSAYHFMQQVNDDVRELEQQYGCKKLLIAELDLNNPRYITDTSKGGYGLDGQWVDEFHHALHSVLTGERNGYYEDFGQLSHLAKTFSDSYVYDGDYSVHRKKWFGASVGDLPFSRFVVFAQNHDQIGNRLLGDRLSTALTADQLKLAAAAVLLSPHVPLLFMGEEYGEKRPFLFFVHHTDEELIESVRKSRKEEFAYFKFEGDYPDPQAEETFLSCVLCNAYDTDPEAQQLLNWYKLLIRFRKERPALRNFDRSGTIVAPVNEADRLLVVERSGNGDWVMIVFNFSDVCRPLPDTLKTLHPVLSSAPPAEGQEPTLQPFSISVFEKKKS